MSVYSVPIEDSQVIERRSFQQDWAIQGDIQTGGAFPTSSNAAVEGQGQGGTPKMPRTNTMPQFSFNEADVKQSESQGEYPKKLQKLDYPAPAQRPEAKDPSQDKLEYLMKLEKKLIKAKSKNYRNSSLIDPQLSEQEQMEEALLEKEQRAALLGKQNNSDQESTLCFDCFCCWRRRKEDEEYPTTIHEEKHDFNPDNSIQ